MIDGGLKVNFFKSGAQSKKSPKYNQSYRTSHGGIIGDITAERSLHPENISNYPLFMGLGSKFNSGFYIEAPRNHRY